MKETLKGKALTDIKKEAANTEADRKKYDHYERTIIDILEQDINPKEKAREIFDLEKSKTNFRPFDPSKRFKDLLDSNKDVRDELNKLYAENYAPVEIDTIGVENQ